MTYYVIRVKTTPPLPVSGLVSGQYFRIEDGAFGPLAVSEAHIKNAQWFMVRDEAEAFIQRRFHPMFHHHFEVKRLDITLH